MYGVTGDVVACGHGMTYDAAYVDVNGSLQENSRYQRGLGRQCRRLCTHGLGFFWRTAPRAHVFFVLKKVDFSIDCNAADAASEFALTSRHTWMVGSDVG